MLGSFLAGGWFSRRLEMRPFSSVDCSDDYLASLNDREHMRFSRQRLVSHTPEAVDLYIAEVRGDGGELIACRLRNTSQLAATVSARCLQDEGVVELGLMTLISYARQGIGYEAWRSAVEVVGSCPEVRRIQAGTDIDNVGMQRVIERSGFTVTGTKCPLYRGESGPQTLVYELDVRGWPT